MGTMIAEMIVMFLIVFVAILVGYVLGAADNNNFSKIIGTYPCSAHLHNALQRIEECKYNSAYSEICHALTKAGDTLTDREIKARETIL